jgi:hypothetical protein
LSYTSPKKFLMASSVCGLVGLAPTEVELRVVVVEVPPPAPPAAVAVAVGWCRSRNLTLLAVMKQDM